jgi:chaperone BCS1
MNIDTKQVVSLLTVGAIGGMIFYLKNVGKAILDIIARCIISTLEFHFPDDSYEMVSHYLGITQNRFKNTAYWRVNTKFYEDAYKPYISIGRGLHIYKYNGKFVLIRLSVREDLGLLYAKEFIWLYTFRWNEHIFKEILDDIKRTFIFENNKIPVYYFDKEGYWIKVTNKTKRNMNTIFGNEEQLTRIINDMKSFLDPSTITAYHNRGMIYKRGYMLYGPPGTGKSSIVISLASKFNLPVFYISLSGLNDTSLFKAFSKAHTPCVILIEDIDRYVFDKQAMSQASDGKQEIQGITLSGMLNTIDSVLSVEGRILMITCNDSTKLDPALIRPGRIDYQIYIDNLKSEDIEKMAKQYFKCDVSIPLNLSIAGSAVENKLYQSENTNDFLKRLYEESE